MRDEFLSFARRFGRSRRSGSAEIGPWTGVVLRHFQKQGISRGFEVYPRTGPRRKYSSEYLVDLCWIEEKDKRGKGHWMELAVEAEWSRYFYPVWYDFYKLLVVRSRLNL